jgi:hypothetical protein
VIGALRRWRARRGTLSDALRAELEAEGLELLEERMPITVIYRGYEFPGQRPRSGHQTGLASLALTGRRLLVHGTGNFRLQVPRGADWLQVTVDDSLKLAYEAGAEHPNRSGDVELRLDTPRAAEIHASLQEWIARPSS